MFPNAKKVLTTKLAKDVAEQFLVWVVCQVAPRAHVQAPQRPQWAHALPVPRAQPCMAHPHMAQPPVVCPVRPICPVVCPPRLPWASTLPVPWQQSLDGDTRHVSVL